MTEAEWLACTDAASMERFLAHRPRERKWRLLACACCRRLWHLLSDERSRYGVEAAEWYADGHIGIEEFREAAGGGAYQAWYETDARDDDDEDNPRYDPHEGQARFHAANAVARLTGTGAAWGYGFGAAGSELLKAVWFAPAGDQRAARAAEEKEHCRLVREVFGNPLRPAAVDPRWLAWNGAAVPELARAAYDERSLPDGSLDGQRLAILADALEEAGCDDETILSHCRGAGPHVRGCWAVDLILGKE